MNYDSGDDPNAKSDSSNEILIDHRSLRNFNRNSMNQNQNQNNQTESTERSLNPAFKRSRLSNDTIANNAENVELDSMRKIRRKRPKLKLQRMIQKTQEAQKHERSREPKNTTQQQAPQTRRSYHRERTSHKSEIKRLPSSPPIDFDQNNPRCKSPSANSVVSSDGLGSGISKSPNKPCYLPHNSSTLRPHLSGPVDNWGLVASDIKISAEPDISPTKPLGNHSYRDNFSNNYSHRNPVYANQNLPDDSRVRRDMSNMAANARQSVFQVPNAKPEPKVGNSHSINNNHNNNNNNNNSNQSTSSSNNNAKNNYQSQNTLNDQKMDVELVSEMKNTEISRDSNTDFYNLRSRAICRGSAQDRSDSEEENNKSSCDEMTDQDTNTNNKKKEKSMSKKTVGNKRVRKFTLESDNNNDLDSQKGMKTRLRNNKNEINDKMSDEGDQKEAEKQVNGADSSNNNNSKNNNNNHNNNNKNNIDNENNSIFRSKSYSDTINDSLTIDQHDSFSNINHNFSNNYEEDNEGNHNNLSDDDYDNDTITPSFRRIESSLPEQHTTEKVYEYVHTHHRISPYYPVDNDHFQSSHMGRNSDGRHGMFFNHHNQNFNAFTSNSNDNNGNNSSNNNNADAMMRDHSMGYDRHNMAHFNNNNENNNFSNSNNNNNSQNHSFPRQPDNSFEHLATHDNLSPAYQMVTRWQAKQYSKRFGDSSASSASETEEEEMDKARFGVIDIEQLERDAKNE